MPADLTNARRKVARAKQDLDTLRNEVAAYLQEKPWRFVEESNHNSYAIRGSIDREPDPEWDIDIGVIGSHARSALDYLVRQLVIASGNDPTRGRTQFPIFLNRDEYVNNRGRRPSHRDLMLKGVDERFRRIIDQLQPYQRGRRVDNDPLVILEAVTNTDKHRDLHAAVAATTGTRFKLHMPDGRVLTVRINRGDRPQWIVDGQIFLGIDNQPPPEAPYQQVKMQVEQINVGLFFANDTRFVSVDDMERAVLHTSRILDRFSRMI